MARANQQLLDDLIEEAARLAATASRYAGEDIDIAAFVVANREKLLLLIAQHQALRGELAGRYADGLAKADPLLRQLTGADPATAVRAAIRLGERGALTPLPKPRRAGKQPVAVEERRLSRLQRDLAEVRDARDRARGQRDWADRERDDVRRELTAALTDRDEALAVVESLRAQLDMARQRAATLGSDTRHAAAVLATVARPADPGPTIDLDPRVQAEAEQVDAPAHPDDARLTAALQSAGLTRDSFLQVLDALQAPTRPVPMPSATARAREFAVTPLGGGAEIGGSCLLVEVGDVRILVDAGMRPKQPVDRAGPPLIGLVESGRIDAIVVTHAHHDHGGYVPALIADHANVAVYCTPDTAALLPTMWADSVKVFERRRLESSAPDNVAPYGRAEVVDAQHRLRPLDIGTVVDVADGVTIELFPAGHILGAAGVVITAGASRVTVTGDVSNLAQATVPGLVVPAAARGSDLLVIESTCCQRNTYREAEVGQFLATVQETISSGGRVLVPAFALGRAQEVALTLRERLPDTPVLIDGMAKQITRIYEQQTETNARPLRIYGEQIREVPPNQRRELITSFRRGVVITTSGMLTAGPAVQWARSVLPDPSAALLLAGHQDEESPGAALLDLSRDSRGGFELDGARVEVKAKIAKFGLTAHADRRGLTSIIRDVGAREVMLVHGLPGPQREFAAHLNRLGRRVAATDRWQS